MKMISVKHPKLTKPIRIRRIAANTSIEYGGKRKAQAVAWDARKRGLEAVIRETSTGWVVSTRSKKKR